MTFIVGSIILASTAAVTAGAMGGIAVTRANRRQDKEEKRAAELDAQLKSLEESRPDFKNPYEGMQNQFANLNNPYANLTVATAAADMQAEQADIALANALDVMMETGAGAGGATALAQAALQSKRGIAASIQAQEVQNQKLAAQGEAQTARLRAQGEQQVMMMRAKGDAMAQQDAIRFHEMQMSRTAGLLNNAQQNMADAELAATSALVSTVGSVGSSLGSAASNIPYV
jgi:hypothetical protein